MLWIFTLLILFLIDRMFGASFIDYFYKFIPMPFFWIALYFLYEKIILFKSRNFINETKKQYILGWIFYGFLYAFLMDCVVAAASLL